MDKALNVTEDKFEPGSVDVFALPGATGVGRLKELVVRKDTKGIGPTEPWFLGKIVVSDTTGASSLSERFPVANVVFAFEGWISEEAGLEHTLPVTGDSHARFEAAVAAGKFSGETELTGDEDITGLIVNLECAERLLARRMLHLWHQLRLERKQQGFAVTRAKLQVQLLHEAAEPERDLEEEVR